ncbi:MAG: hypothetical protein HY815_09435 [Candidatus Riflebacteria bacterium]|nr:hypothetical protein [Candidatus Riflebacteria bacterium]
MEVIRECQVPVQRPYLHLAYTAATAAIPEPLRPTLAVGLLVVSAAALLRSRLGVVPRAWILGPLALGLLGLLFVAGAGSLTSDDRQVAAGLLVVFAFVAFTHEVTRRFSKGEPPAPEPVPRGAGRRWAVAATGLYIAGLMTVLASYWPLGNPVYLHPASMTKGHMTLLAEKIREYQGLSDERLLLIQAKVEEPPKSVKPLSPDLRELRDTKDWEARYLEDGWHQPMRVVQSAPSGIGWQFVSAGPDGQFSTPDDLVGVGDGRNVTFKKQ